MGTNDRDGNAVRADVAGVGISYSYTGDLWTMIATGGYVSTSYDKANPVYDKKTDSNTYSLGVILGMGYSFGKK